MNKTKHVERNFLIRRRMLAVPGIFVLVERLDTESGMAGALHNASQKDRLVSVCVSETDIQKDSRRRSRNNYHSANIKSVGC